jgi:hypothetical protein
MNKEANREAIIKILQDALKPTRDLSPQYIADSILYELEYLKTTNDLHNDSVTNAVEKAKIKLLGSLQNAVTDLQAATDEDLKNTTKEDEVLLRNFIHGKLTAYEEFIDIISKA